MTPPTWPHHPDQPNQNHAQHRAADPDSRSDRPAFLERSSSPAWPAPGMRRTSYLRSTKATPSATKNSDMWSRQISAHLGYFFAFSMDFPEGSTNNGKIPYRAATPSGYRCGASGFVSLHRPVEPEEIHISAVGLGENTIALRIAFPADLLGLRGGLGDQHGHIAVRPGRISWDRWLPWARNSAASRCRSVCMR